MNDDNPSEIIRHEQVAREIQPSGGDGELIDEITEHIEAHIGPVGGVFHEIISDLVHVDIHVVSPRPERDWATLVTSGMSELPMNLPDGVDARRFAEMQIALPRDWPLEHKAFRDERNYWPIRLLKDFARLPHMYDTWLGPGHSMPNGDPPEPYAKGTDLCGAMVWLGLLVPDEFDLLTLPDGREIQFLAVFPMHADEMDFKLQHGGHALMERFVEAGISEGLDPFRPSVFGGERRKKRFGRLRGG